MILQPVSARPFGADLGRLWWLLFLRGLLMIAFGILAVGFTRTAVEALTTLLGVFLIFDGLVTLITTALTRRRLQRGNWLAGQGFVALVIGIIVLLLPGLITWTAFSLFVIWGAIALGLLAGVAMLRFAFSIQRAGGTFGTLGVLGGVSTTLAVVLAVMTTLNPAGMALGLLWLLGIGAIMLGLLVSVWSFVLRRAVRETVTMLPPQRM
jgi:uncharacterized membrane protein HdeD (DUF308 family)